MYVIIIYRVIIVLLCIIVVVVLQIHLHFRKVAKESPTLRDFGETFFVGREQVPFLLRD